MKKIIISIAAFLSASNLSAATLPSTGDLSQLPYIAAGYSFTQINYKSTDSIQNRPTSGYPNAINSPLFSFSFPISAIFNVEAGYTFPSAVTGGQSQFHWNSHTSYLKLMGHYSLANNFALLLGAGPGIITMPASYFVTPAQGIQPSINTPFQTTIMDFNLSTGAQYFFNQKLGVKAELNYGLYKSAYRKSSLSELLSLIYLI